jgi:hypothetical protein
MRLVHGSELRVYGKLFPQYQGSGDSRAKKIEKEKKLGKRLQEAGRFLFKFRRCAMLMERHDFEKCSPELLPGQGIGVASSRSSRNTVPRQPAAR